MNYRRLWHNFSLEVISDTYAHIKYVGGFRLVLIEPSEPLLIRPCTMDARNLLTTTH